MQRPASNQLLRLWVLVLFCLTLGVSVASPIVKPQRLHIVCSGAGTGATVLLAQADDHAAQAPGALGLLDCPLCLATHAAGSPALNLPAPAAAPQSTPQHMAQAPASRTPAGLPPARAPPPFFN